jgi:ribosomal protein L11
VDDFNSPLSRPPTSLISLSLSVGKKFAGTITMKHIYEIAVVKAKDPKLSHLPLPSVCKMLIGSCRSIGIKVLPGKPQAE